MNSDEPRSSDEPSPGAEPPPGYVWVHVPPRPPQPERKTRRWLVGTVIVWAIALVVAAIVYAFHGTATVREQTTIAQSQRTVDTAVGRVVAAAGPGPIVAVGGFERVQSCSVTLVRNGAEYQRTVDLYAAPGGESALLHTIASGLPASYKANAGQAGVMHLDADAGDFVGLVGSAPNPGDVQVRAETGCRPVGSIAAPPAAPAMASDEMAPVRAALTALGATATSTSAAQVPCATGPGVLRTVSARATASGAGSLAKALASVAPLPALAQDDLVAYRSAGVDVVVTRAGTVVTVSATTGCRS